MSFPDRQACIMYISGLPDNADRIFPPYSPMAHGFQPQIELSRRQLVNDLILDQTIVVHWAKWRQAE